jgi:hypothetical protein
MTLQSTSMRSIALGLVLAFALVGTADAQEPQKHGQLRIARAAKGKIEVDTDRPTAGQASFTVRGWEFLLAADTDGIDPANEPFSLDVGEERFLIPAGSLRVSRNGRKFRYKTRTDRGVQQLLLVRTTEGVRVTLKVVGVDLSSLLIADPPLCLPFAVIIGNDDGFSGVSFDRPKPYPSKLLTLPGFCVPDDWPWG